MSFRRRLTLAAAAAVCIVAVVLSLAAYLLVRNLLRDEVDDSLRTQAGLVERLEADTDAAAPRVLVPAPRLRPAVGEPEAYVQIVSRGGGVVRPGGGRSRVPVDESAPASRREREGATTSAKRQCGDASCGCSLARSTAAGWCRWPAR